VAAGIASALGTSLLSRWQDDFVFTWPLTVFVLFYLAALWLPFRRKQLDSQVKRSSLLGAVVIAASTGAYFCLCRRLSLVFEWAFLVGYLPALLAVVADRWISGTMLGRWWKTWAVALTTLLGFAAFYWSGVALLWLRYR